MNKPRISVSSLFLQATQKVVNIFSTTRQKLSFLKKLSFSTSLVPAATLLMGTTAWATPTVYVFYNDHLQNPPQIEAGDIPLSSDSCVNLGRIVKGETVTKEFSMVSSKIHSPFSSATSGKDSLDHINIVSDTEAWFEWNVSTNATTADLANAVAVESGKVTHPPLSTSTVGTFQLQFTPLATPAPNTSLQVYATGGYETTPLNVPLTAAVVESPLPKIRVTDTTDSDQPVDMVKGVTADFSSTTPTVTKTFLIENVGARNLLLYSKTATFTPDEGTGASDFTVTAFADDGQADGGFPPAPVAMTIIAPVPQGCPNLSTTAPDYTTFTVTFTAPPVKQSTIVSGTISFTSNDNDVPETNFSFPVTATVAPATMSQPELDVYDEAGHFIAHQATTPVDFGTTAVGATVSQMLLVKNPSTVPLTILNVGSTLPQGLSLASPHSYPITVPPEGETRLTFQLNATVAGTFTGELQIDSDDGDNPIWTENGGGVENPYLIPLKVMVSAVNNLPDEPTTGTPTTGTPTTGTPTTGTPTTQVKLTVTSPTYGTIMSNPAGIHCGTDSTQCMATFDSQTVVQLTAIPAAGILFDSWSGDCASHTGNPLSVTMDKAKNCSALFKSVGVTLTITPPAQGTLISTPTGIHCGTGDTQCTADYSLGQEVTLMAIPDTNSTFTHWIGSCMGVSNPLVITMDKAKHCSANFDSVSLPKPLMVSKIGNGVLTSDSGDIHCGDQCTASYTPGQTVTLTATPASDSMFAGWGGDCSSAGTSDTAVVTMDTAKNCTALFSLKFFITVCPPTGSAPLTVTAEAEGLSIPNATYHWQSPGNPQVSISDQATTLFTFDVSGIHTIGLTVTDASGQVMGQTQTEVAVDVFPTPAEGSGKPVSYSDLGTALIVGARGSLENATTAFLGGIAVNHANSFDKISRVKLCEEVDVRGLIKVNPAHVGQPAEMVVYANAEPYGYYMLEESPLNILPWDEKPENLLPFRKAVTLAAEQPVEMYKGHFYYPGKVSVFFGYRLTDGTVVTSDQAIEVTIRE